MGYEPRVESQNERNDGDEMGKYWHIYYGRET